MTADTPRRRFPLVAGRDLTGRPRRLPVDIDATSAVVVIAFRQHHQRLVDRWAPVLDDLCAGHPQVRWYEVPAIGRQWTPVRRFIDGGMARHIGDPVVLARTVTVYGDVSALTDPLGITDRSTVAAVLTDPAGNVGWFATGGPDGHAVASLASAVAGGPPSR